MPDSTNLVRSNGSLQLPTRVNLLNVTGLYEDFQRLFDGGVDCLDCREVKEADSSAISLLLACVNLAGRHNRVLDIKGMNNQLNSLARLYGVETLLRDPNS